MFNVWGYGRASTDMQVLSTEKQCEKLLEAFEAYKVIKYGWRDNARWAGFMRDEATGRQTKFCERHAGSLVIAACQPGDVIMVSDYDRIFAGVVDVCESLELLRARKTSLIILDSDFDTTTNIGDFAFKVIALVKEMEVREIRKRIKEGKAHRRKLGIPCGPDRPVGWKVVVYRVPGRNYVGIGDRSFVPDNAARHTANLLLAYQRKHKISVKQLWKVASTVHELRHPAGIDWKYNTCRKWIKAAERGFPLPNGSFEPHPIPPNAYPVKPAETIAADPD